MFYAMVGLLVFYYGVLVQVSTVSAHAGHTDRVPHGAPERQVIQGDDGWELEISSSPTPAMVGHLTQLAIWLRKDGVVFPGMMEVTIAVANLEEGQAVVETHSLARQGYTAQSLQLYDGGLHTVAVTVRAVGGASGWKPPTAVLSMDVVALHPPLAVQSRMMAILLGALAVGMIVGFFVPWTYS